MPSSPRAHYRHTKLEAKGHFARGSFRTISIGRHGRKMVVGCPKGYWSKKTKHCRAGMRKVTMLTRKRASNRSRYTVATAPRRVRMKWLKKAQAARKYYARCRKKYGVHLQHQAGSHHLGFSCGSSGPGPVIPPVSQATVPPPPPVPEYASSRMEGHNPELLIYSNPGRRYFYHGVGSMKVLRRSVSRGRGVKRHRRTNMRRRHRRSRNYPVTASVGGRKHTWKSLVKKLGVKKAAKAWRKGKRYHGYTKTRCMNRRHKRRSRR